MQQSWLKIRGGSVALTWLNLFTRNQLLIKLLLSMPDSPGKWQAPGAQDFLAKCR
jgi:hypothetical protein